MDASLLDTFQLNIQKQSPTAISVSFVARVSQSVGPDSMFSFLQSRRSEILASPEVAGFQVAPDGEDVTLNPTKRTISGTFRLVPMNKS